MAYDARSALDRIIASSSLGRAPKLASLLRVLVEDYLAGRAESPKEYELGVRAFQRAPDYDPQSDPIVRVQARQLRFKLNEYYATTGADDPIRFSLEKGSYLLECSSNAAPPEHVPQPENQIEQVQPAPAVVRKLNWRLPASAIAAVLLIVGVWIAVRDRKPVVHAHGGNSAAEELYLKGRFYWNKRTPDDLRTALDLFTQAVVKDPTYAKAYLGLADTYSLLREYAGMPDQEAFLRATAAARKAVELDDSLAEAHASLAFCLFHGLQQFEAGLREFRRAVQLNPSYSTAHQWYANALLSMGRFDEAEQENEKARQLDPGSRSILADKGKLEFHRGHVEEAITTLRQIADAEPTFVSAHLYLRIIYLAQHDCLNYLQEARITAQLQGDPGWASALERARISFDTGGERRMLESLLKSYQALYDQGTGEAFPVAAMYARLGDKQNAMRFLELAHQRKELLMEALPVDDAFIVLRGEPAYQALLKNLGLVEPVSARARL
jgi:tetratricopeptide (TPR) repeat protein